MKRGLAGGEKVKTDKKKNAQNKIKKRIWENFERLLKIQWINLGEKLKTWMTRTLRKNNKTALNETIKDSSPRPHVDWRPTTLL